MKRYDRITPEGTKDLLFEECEARAEIINTLQASFQAAKYRQIVTPGFEFYDVFSNSEMYYPQEKIYKLMDDKGRMLVARPDSTIPIARLVSTKLKGHPLPLKLYYNQNVFRKSPGLRGRSDEIMQMGVERIGESSFESDIEILSLSAKALADCLTEDYRIEIGHVGIFKLLMDNIKADQEQKLRIHEFIAAKNYAALSAKLDRLTDDQTTKILRELPKLFGAKEIFIKAEELFDGYDRRLIEMLTYLKDIYQSLSDMGLEDQIIIDFGLVNQADYYSSIVFRGYIRTVGEPVLSGGRYDHLLKDFGYDVPAIGFAINVDLLSLNVLKQQDEKKPVARADNHLRIALTKGRLENDALELFRAMGLVDQPLLEKGRKLLLTLPGGEIDIVFAKAADVITYVEHGACDLGIVGMDTIMESEGTFYEVLNLGFGQCKFVLAGPKNAEQDHGFNIKRVASKYPKVAGDYFEELGMDVEIIKIEGSVELAPILTLADAIVDIMETGSTLKANGLSVIQEIQDLSARLIVNEASMKFKKKEIDGLILGIEKELGVRYEADNS